MKIKVINVDTGRATSTEAPEMYGHFTGHYLINDVKAVSDRLGMGDNNTPTPWWADDIYFEDGRGRPMNVKHVMIVDQLSDDPAHRQGGVVVGYQV